MAAGPTVSRRRSTVGRSVSDLEYRDLDPRVNGRDHPDVRLTSWTPSRSVLATAPPARSRRQEHGVSALRALNRSVVAQAMREKIAFAVAVENHEAVRVREDRHRRRRVAPSLRDALCCRQRVVGRCGD